MRFSKHALLSTIALFATACATQQTSAPISPATTPEEGNLVDIRSLVPDIDLDIRYAGANNFTGAPVDGYEAPKCFLLRPVAEALARVERTLRDDHMRLRLYDCYRPVRAVQNFVAWAHAPEDGRTKAAYYPAFEKPALLGDYISPTSGHSRGATVDLDLMECDDTGVACTPLDMGTHVRLLRHAREHRFEEGHRRATREPPPPARCDGGAGLSQLSDGVVALHLEARAVTARCLRHSRALNPGRTRRSSSPTRRVRGRCDW